MSAGRSAQTAGCVLALRLLIVTGLLASTPPGSTHAAIERLRSGHHLAVMACAQAGLAGLVGCVAAPVWLLQSP
ncbi:MAG: hypothetical protein JSW67_10665 [Candidatus Latescibacterota bacterium]|nr:MAG: hypothetical protein JSW67_10665 [Candidatus Latescibacterota bacterium]